MLNKIGILALNENKHIEAEKFFKQASQLPLVPKHESYAKNYIKNKEKSITPYIDAAKKAVELGLGINAGHDLSLDNL